MVNIGKSTKILADWEPVLKTLLNGHFSSKMKGQTRLLVKTTLQLFPQIIIFF
jgi:hypothetical protein